MANRRSKIQPNAVKRLLVTAGIMALALTAIISIVGRKDFGLVHRLAFESLGPVQVVFGRTTQFVTGIWHNYLNLIDVTHENDRLRQEIKQYIVLNAQYREAAATNARLNQLLNLAQSFEGSITAQVIGRDPALWFKTITIDKGLRDGVKKNMAVVTVEGVVGQVIDVGSKFAKVLLANDPNSAIDALIQRNRAIGIIKGDGQGYRLDYVLKGNEVIKDDFVVTSGMGEIFPKGLVIGQVVDIGKDKRGMFNTITVKPAVEFHELEYVTVLMKAKHTDE
jgi:rod shape-determining protein MreC